MEARDNSVFAESLWLDPSINSNDPGPQVELGFESRERDDSRGVWGSRGAPRLRKAALINCGSRSRCINDVTRINKPIINPTRVSHLGFCGAVPRVEGPLEGEYQGWIFFRGILDSFEELEGKRP